MNKIKALTVSLLLAVSFPSLGMAQQATKDVGVSQKGVADVAMQLYELNQRITKLQGILESRHQDLIEAIGEYDKDASARNIFLRALQKDAEAAQQYSSLVAQAKIQIAEAQSKYYEETPATQAEIETGPKGIGTPAGGESVEHEIPEAPAVVEHNLKVEISRNAGIHSNFKEQLKAQAEKLKSVQTRIQDEASSPAVQKNPVAKKENQSLLSILSKAIDARRKALGED